MSLSRVASAAASQSGTRLQRAAFAPRIRDAGEMFAMSRIDLHKQLHGQPPTRSPPASFYQRELPNQQISFSCPEGRSLFQEALGSGQMESYFYLAEQFQTQAEPTFCGLATLAMVLNALRIDPMRNWKGSWRWFTEENLGCDCVTPASVKEQGISMERLASLADCNGAATQVTRAPNASPDSQEAQEFTEFFRESVRETCSNGERNFLVASYGRGFLGQTGDGHFSPIGGYHEKSDAVLIMDVARFKYPSHWAPLKDVAAAMLLPDSATGMPRGFMRLRPHEKAVQPQRSTSKQPLKVSYLPKAAGQWNAGALLQNLAMDQKKLSDFDSWSMLAVSRWLSAVEATSPGLLGKIVAVDDMALFTDLVKQIHARSELFRTLCRAYAELQVLGLHGAAFPPLFIYGCSHHNCQSLEPGKGACGELWILFLLLLPPHLRAAVSEELAEPNLSSEICKLVRCPWALPMEALKESLHLGLNDRGCRINPKL